MKIFGLTYHWQNLCERVEGADRKTLTERIPLHGRLWLKREVVRRDGRESVDGVGHVEWSAGKARHLGVTFGVDGSDGEVDLFLGVPGLALWVSFGSRVVRRVLEATGAKSYDNREVSLRFHDGGVWWELWRDKWGGWSRETPRWRSGNFKPIDALLGPQECSFRLLHEQEADVAFPEMTYRVKVKLEEGTWKRPRWPFPRRRVCAHIDAPMGIPTDHKGPIFGLSTAADSVAEAVGALVGCVLRSRSPNHLTAWIVKPRVAAGASE